MSKQQVALLACVLSALLFLPAPLFARVCVESAVSCCCCEGCADSDLAISCSTTDCCLEIPMQSEHAASRVAPSVLHIAVGSAILYALHPPVRSYQEVESHPPAGPTARRLAALCVFLN